VHKPFSQACVNNQQPISDVLKRVFGDRQQVLEIASGTGQHAVHFSAVLPHLQWQCSDLAVNHPGINAWLDDALQAGASNIARPLTLDVTQPGWPCLMSGARCDALFSANSLHIMPWSAVEALFTQLNTYLPIGAIVAIYGPFNYNGCYTSESNQQFDGRLYLRSPLSAIRDFEAVNALAQDAGLELLEDNAMPANNRLLVWRKTC
tara:strand:- start:1059 stop:1676 length:618 start_codon:yes stop_codon:yes gene_type:complete